MEKLKPLGEVFEPDPRMDAYRPTLEWDHKRLSDITLTEEVPEDVKNYFETIKNLCLYGRFVYPFYSVAADLTYLLIELALNIRLGKPHRSRKSNFRQLLREAIKNKLIDEDRFSHIQRIKEEQAQHHELLHDVIGDSHSLPRTGDYLKILTDALPDLRNRIAHPKYRSLHWPSHAFFSIRFAAEFINQLYSPSKQATGNRK